MNKYIKILMSVIFVIFSSFLLSGCTTSDEKIAEYNRAISDADLLIDGKEYTLAIEKLSSAAELIPTKVDAIERIVKIFVSKNRLDDATKIVDDSGSELQDSDRASLYVLVGDAQYSIKSYDKALYNYQLAQGMDSGNEKASLGIGKVYLQKGEIENARNLLKKKYTGDSYIESKILISSIESLTDTEKAKESIKDVEPGDTWRDIYTEWSKVLESLDTDTLFNGAKLARGYLDMGYPYLAIAVLEPNLEKMSEYIDGVYMLGKAYYENGQYEKSISVLENSTSLSDLNQYIYWVLARDYLLIDDSNTSFSYYDSAISYAGNNVEEELLMEYLDTLIKEDLTEKALEVMKSAERVYAKDWVTMYYMEIYSLRSDEERFNYFMKKITYEELSDDLKPLYLFSKGKYLIKNSNFDEAKRTLDIFWDLDKYDPRYNYLVAELNFQEGKLDDARMYAKKAIEYDLTGLVSQDAQKLLAQID